MLRYTTIDMLDSVKNEFSEMLNHVSWTETVRNNEVQYQYASLPKDKGVTFTSDSTSFYLSKKKKYTFRYADIQKIEIFEDTYHWGPKSVVMLLPNLNVYWEFKNIEYAKKFADDLIYFKHKKDLEKVKNGSTSIANILKNDSIIRQVTAASSVSNESKNVVNTNESTTTKTNEKDITFSPVFRIIKPIPTWIWATAISGIETPSNFKSNYGNISNWGFGSGLDMHMKNGFTLFFDINTYRYKLEIAEKGGTVHPALGNAESAGVGIMTLSDGAKYTNNTTSLRLGVKYNFLRNKVYQPWVGIAYGISVYSVKYLTWNEDKIYGKASGNEWTPTILAGIDFKTKDMGTYTIFFEGIGTKAEYTMTNLFGLGDYDTHGASAEMGIPTPRIGISCSF